MNSSDATAAIMYQPATGRGVKRSSIPIPLLSGISASLAAAQAFLPLSALRERNRIEHGRALVAQDREGAADGAGRFVLAIAARRIMVDACARDQRDRPFERAHHLAER